MSQRNAKWSIPLLGLGIALSACSGSGSSLLRSMNFETKQQNEETLLQLSTEVHLGSMSLREMQIPIPNPQGGLPLGTIGLGSTPDGKQKLTLSLRAASLALTNLASSGRLPNGLPLPAALSSGAIGIPILNSSQVYVGGSLDSSVVLGLALTLPALDAVTSRIPISSNYFFQRGFAPNLRGIAGIYSSPARGGSGIAIFANFKFNPTAASPGKMMAQKERVRTTMSPEEQLSLLRFFAGEGRVLSPE